MTHGAFLGLVFCELNFHISFGCIEDGWVSNSSRADSPSRAIRPSVRPKCRPNPRKCPKWRFSSDCPKFCYRLKTWFEHQIRLQSDCPNRFGQPPIQPGPRAWSFGSSDLQGFVHLPPLDSGSKSSFRNLLLLIQKIFLYIVRSDSFSLSAPTFQLSTTECVLFDAIELAVCFSNSMGIFFCAIVTVIVAEKQINAMHAIWLDSFNLELWADLVVVVVLRIQCDDVYMRIYVCAWVYAAQCQ